MAVRVSGLTEDRVLGYPANLSFNSSFVYLIFFFGRLFSQGTASIRKMTATNMDLVCIVHCRGFIHLS